MRLIQVRGYFFGFFILFVAFLANQIVWPTRACAQTEAASVSGRVMDESNAVVPGVEVEIKNVDTGVTQVTKTNGDGFYSFPYLQPGSYLMNVRKAAFRTISLTGISLHVQDEVSRNFVLQVGSSAVSITISAADSMWATTDSPAVSTLVTRDFVENMPLNGRSFADLIALTPGAVSSVSNNGTFSINGQRDNANYFMVDGVGANIGSGNGFIGNPQSMSGTLPAQSALGTTQPLLSVDALEEFRIETSGYTADSGRQPGGQVQLRSRSGTNEWHGSGFDYLRNTVFDANSFFNNEFGIPRGAERQNDFGGTIGGPVVMPRLYDGKDRTFFFFSYEGLRLLLPNSVQTFVPSAALRQAAAPGVQKALNAYPVANGPANTADGCTVTGAPGGAPCDAQFNAGYSNPSNLDAVAVRLDQNWGQKWRLFGRYAYTPSSNVMRLRTPSDVEADSANVESLTIGATVVFSPNVIDDVRFNFSQSKSAAVTYLDNFGGAVPFDRDLTIFPQYVTDGTYAGSAVTCIPHSRLCSGLLYQNTPTNQRQYNFIDGVSFTHGNHTLKFGVDYRRLLPSTVEGVGSYAAFVGPKSLAQVEQGLGNGFVQAYRPVNPKFTSLSLYAEDHYRVSSHLSFDYGLRWEFNPVPGAVNGLTPLGVTQVSDLANMQIAPLGTSAYHTRYLNFAPRVGFAWGVVPSGKHSVVLRGGFGLYYDTGQAEWAAGYENSGPPFGSSISYNNVPFPASAADLAPAPISTSPTPPYSFFSIMDPHIKLPYTEQYNLSLDVGLTTHNTLTVSYVGNQGHGLLETQTYSVFPNPDFIEPSITYSDAASSYSALQVQDRGFVAPGLEALISYTWAHSMDDVSTDFSQFSAPIRGNSDNDVRQALNLAMNYAIPSSSSTRFLGVLTKGWLWANRFTVQSGNPFSIVQGQYIDSANRTINIYPNLVPGVPLYLHNVPNVPAGWQLNPAAFELVALNPDGSPIQQGNLPRNFLRLPSFWNLNTAIQRTFPIHERLRLVFRAEAFNVLNHSNFTSVDGSIGDPTFGQLFATQTIGTPNQLYATGSPRSWQFMLKLQF